MKSLKSIKYDHPLYRDVNVTYRDYSVERPISEEVFKVYLKQFIYDKGKIDPRLIYSRTEENWIREKVRI